MTTTFDAHKNLAVSAVAVAPSPAGSGTTLAVTFGDGARFPSPPFNCTVWPATAGATQANAEIVRVTNIAGDTFTVVRAVEGSMAQSIAAGEQIALASTAKVFTDIEAAINAALGGSLSGTLPNPGIAAGAVGTAQLAANAATQHAGVVGSTSGPTTTSTSYVDLPDMSVTVTTVGGDLLVWGQCDISQSAAGGNSANLALKLDSAAEAFPVISQASTAAFTVPLSLVGYFTGVAAGSHTVKLRWLTSSGTATANGARRSLTVLEVRR